MSTHDKYCTIWDGQIAERSDRIQTYLEGKEVEISQQNWMKGLAGLKFQSRVRRVQSSTGRHFGSQQKQSILSYGPKHN